MSEQDEIVKEFLVETLESLDTLDQALVDLESEQNSQETVNHIFRVLHTIKGTCGFLGFPNLERISHIGENILDGVRTGRLETSALLISGLLSLVDAIRRLAAEIENTGTEGREDFSELVARLTQINDGERTSQKPPESEQALPPEANLELLEELLSHELLPEERVALVGQDQSEELPTTEIAKEHVESETEQCEEQPPIPEESSIEQETEIQPAPVARAATAAEPSETTIRGSSGSGVAESFLRVDVNALDSLMNLVGELVLTRNQILQLAQISEDAQLSATTHRLNIITSELQEGIMKTRMQPIATVWNKFPRVVRDVARACGKEIQIEMLGKETDLDKTILEAIKDPLTHIVRNAADHGIESPDVREQLGKPRKGTLTLKAYHEGGFVIIEIEDDGKGIDSEKLKAKAIESGVIRSQDLERMSEADVLKLIFAPGLSTAEKVTNISGRGVGMDVVRSNIERIGGSVDIQSHLGVGTTLRVKIPLTLAIIPALLVKAGDERFAIPQVSLVELIRVERKDISERIERIGESYYYRLRGNLLPLVSLGGVLEIDYNYQDSDVINIVVVHADEKKFGLIVQAIHDTQEIVVKPLSKQLKNVTWFAGATILGDGQVALIVDVLGVAKRADLRLEGNQSTRSSSSEEDGSGSGREVDQLLVVGVSTRTCAIPLSTVDRLEKFERNRIEQVAGSPVVQYRGGILPLADLPSLFGSGSHSEENDLIHVVKLSYRGKPFGLIVDEIRDIVSQPSALQPTPSSFGVKGSLVVADRVIEVLGLPEIAERLLQGYFDNLQSDRSIA